MVLLFSICILGGCKDTEAETVQGKTVKAESSEQLLVVNGQLDYKTKKTDSESLRCGMMDGEIDSMVGRTDCLLYTSGCDGECSPCKASADAG